MYRLELIKKSLAICLISLSLTSCTSTKSAHGSFNNDFKTFTNDNFKKTTTNNYVKDSIKEVVNNEKSLNIDNSKRLSTLLEELGQMDGNVYILSKDANDIFVHAIKNSYKLKLNSFEKLNQFIKDTSNYLVYIKKNRFLKNRIKVVSVNNQDSFSKNLKNIPFSINGKQSISDILEQLRDVSGYNVVAKNIPQEDKKSKKSTDSALFSNNSFDKLFENTYILNDADI